MADDRIIYCQIVVGAPGSGKTTYCTSMKHFMEQVGRESLLINLDPANEAMKNISAVSLTDLITVDDVMSDMQLGPNGGLIYCMEWLEEHLDLLKDCVFDALDQHPHCRYVLFDFPGQIELYTNCTSIRNILQIISREWRFRPVVVHLTDSLLCKDPSHYISSLMVSLSVMMNLEMPHVNVMTKSDLLNPDELSLPIEAFEGTEYLNFVANQIDQEYNYIPPNQSDNEDGDHNDNNNHVYQDSFSDDGEEMKRNEYDIDGESPECHTTSNYSSNRSHGKNTTSQTTRHRIAHPIKVYDENGVLSYLDDNDDDLFFDFPDSFGANHDDDNDDGIDGTNGDTDGNHSNTQLEKYMKFHRSLNRSLAELIQDYSLISLTKLSVHDKYMMNDVLTLVDKANGYVFKDVDLSNMRLDHFTNAAESQMKQIEGMTVVPRTRPS